MMKEEEPPSYESVRVAVCSSTSSVNAAFVPDEATVYSSASSVNAAFVPDEDLARTGRPSQPGLEASPQIQFASFPPLTSEEIKRACHFYVTERCCYGSAFIENMSMIDVSDRIAYHYTLESYGEKRETAEKIKPYYGGSVDGPECGPTHRPWDMPVMPSKYFQNEKKIVEMPHTSYVKACAKCSGKGDSNCKWCFGMGGSGCVLCISSKNFRPCTNCKYSNRRCLFCDGKGTEKCRTCNGQGKLLAYKILIVTWTNHEDHFVTDALALPPEEMMTAEGKPVFTDEGEKLSPVWNVPNTSVIVASTDLINRHRSGFDNEIVRRQRHTLRAIPFTQVKYRWRENLGEFYVYGLQKKAYFENYPQQCCCCCSIM